MLTILRSRGLLRRQPSTYPVTAQDKRKEEEKERRTKNKMKNEAMRCVLLTTTTSTTATTGLTSASAHGTAGRLLGQISLTASEEKVREKEKLNGRARRTGLGAIPWGCLSREGATHARVPPPASSVATSPADEGCAPWMAEAAALVALLGRPSEPLVIGFEIALTSRALLNSSSPDVSARCVDRLRLTAMPSASMGAMAHSPTTAMMVRMASRLGIASAWPTGRWPRDAVSLFACITRRTAQKVTFLFFRGPMRGVLSSSVSLCASSEYALPHVSECGRMGRWLRAATCSCACVYVCLCVDVRGFLWRSQVSGPSRENRGLWGLDLAWSHRPQLTRFLRLSKATTIYSHDLLRRIGAVEPHRRWCPPIMSCGFATSRKVVSALLTEVQKTMQREREGERERWRQ